MASLAASAPKAMQLAQDLAPAVVGIPVMVAGYLDLLQVGIAIAVGVGSVCLLIYRIKIARRTWRRGQDEDDAI